MIESERITHFTQNANKLLGGISKLLKNNNNVKLMFRGWGSRLLTGHLLRACGSRDTAEKTVLSRLYRSKIKVVRDGQVRFLFFLYNIIIVHTYGIF